MQANIRAVQIAKGVFIICFLNFLSQFFELTLVSVLIEDVMTWGIIAIVIIFQPEIRTGLEQVGRKSGIKKVGSGGKDTPWISEVSDAVKYLAEERTGALIVLENKVALSEIIGLATPLDSVITSELLRTIFRNKTPLHDGAVIVREGRIACAGAILPATTREDLPQTTGTRHRAAIGVTEISDSISIIVSEETGRISIANGGQIESFEKHFHFEQALRALLTTEVASDEE